jgi:hypothetical protein
MLVFQPIWTDLKSRKPLILLGMLEIGAGDGNRTLVSIPCFEYAKNPLNTTYSDALDNPGRYQLR